MAEEITQTRTSEYPDRRNLTSPQAARDVCLFHSPKSRGTYQQLVNVMRSSTLIPKTLLCKVSGAVCTCQSYDFHETLDDSVIVECKRHKKLLKDVVNKILGDIHLNNVQSILSCLVHIKSLTNEKSFQLGCRRLLYIILMATRDNYDPLKYNKQTSVKIQDNGEKEQHVEEFDIEFVPAYISFLFGKNGKNIKQFARLHNCQLKVLGNTRCLGYSTNTSTMILQMKYSKIEQAKVIKDDLNALMKEIIKKREIQNKKVLEYWQARQKRFDAQRARNEAKAFKGKGINGQVLGSAYKAACQAKVWAQDNYSTKYHHMLKAKSSRNHEKENPRPKILEQGNSWCVNCMLTYSKDTQTECKYHKGYVDMQIRAISKHRRKQIYQWTCCGEVLAETPKGAKMPVTQADRLESHQKTGCTEAKQHVWKPHKKASLSKNSGKQALLGTSVGAVY